MCTRYSLLSKIHQDRNREQGHSNQSCEQSETSEVMGSTLSADDTTAAHL